jgi:malate synthase
VRQVLAQTAAATRAAVGEETWQAGRPDETRAIFERVALAEPMVEFLTLEAYEYLD